MKGKSRKGRLTAELIVAVLRRAGKAMSLPEIKREVALEERERRYPTGTAIDVGYVLGQMARCEDMMGTGESVIRLGRGRYGYQAAPGAQPFVAKGPDPARPPASIEDVALEALRTIHVAAVRAQREIKALLKKQREGKS